MKRYFFRFNNRINTKLIVITITIVFLSMIGASYYAYVKMTDIIVQNSFIHAGATISQTAEKIKDRIDFTLDQFGYLELNKSFIEVYRNSGNENYMNDLIKLSREFEETRSKNSDIIDSIYFLRNDGKVFYEYVNGVCTNTKFENLSWYRTVKNNKGNILWLPPRKSELFVNQNSNVVGVIKDVTNDKFESVGVLVLDIKERYLKKELSRVNLGKQNDFFITDEDGNLISYYGKEDIKDTYKDYISMIKNNNTRNKYMKITHNGEKSLLVYDDIGTNNWRVVGIIPMKSLIDNSEILTMSMIGAVLLSIILSFFLLLFMIKNVTYPLTKITKVICKIESGDMKVRIDDSLKSKDDEIGILSRNFNNMLDRITNLIDEVKWEKAQKSQAELRVLQQQINSHFLYNTLDSIYWKVETGEKKDSAKMILLLSKFIRLTLNRGNNITTVGNEIEHMESYIEIEKLRSAELFEYSIAVDKSLYNYKIPKFLLQPLVENAIQHGIFENNNKGLITITGKISDELLVFCVSDNGVGMNIEDISESVFHNNDNGKECFALKNIHKRIKMIYGQKGKIEFKNNFGGGTKIIITLPKE